MQLVDTKKNSRTNQIIIPNLTFSVEKSDRSVSIGLGEGGAVGDLKTLERLLTDISTGENKQTYFSFTGAIRSLVNARGLQLECARVLHETLLVPVLVR